MKAYLDNNVVSSISRDDNASESDAISRLLDMYDQGALELVTSEITLQEIQKVPPEHRRPLERTYRLIEKVPLVSSASLLYINSYGSGSSWVSSPVFQNDPLFDELVGLGLEPTDATHIYVATKNSCDAFITCDDSRKTGILRRTVAIAQLCCISVQRPSELVATFT
jgi:predicted nucleic acid-binding protein